MSSKANLYQDVVATIKKSASSITPFHEKVKPHQAEGRVLAAAVISIESIPSFDNSSMDGFAVRTSEVKSGENCFKVLKRIIAGDAPSEVADLNIAVQIMTGAPIPAGFDAIVKLEDTLLMDLSGQANIVFKGPVVSGQFVRRAGEDFKNGDCIANPGDRVDAKLIMGMAALGVKEISVVRKPKVWVISTGNEIVEYDQEVLAPGEIRNSSAPFLIEELRRLGCEVNYRGIIKDVENTHVASEYENTLRAALDESIDIVISTGALSMGVHDFAKDIVVKLGGDVLFHKVAIRPGKPVLFAQFPKNPNTHFIGLPGNPISTVVGTQFFVRPFLDEYFKQSSPRTVQAKLIKTAKKPEGLRCFFKGHWFVNEKGESCIDVLEGQASFMIHSLIKANAWVVLPEENDVVVAGKLLEVYPFE